MRGERGRGVRGKRVEERGVRGEERKGVRREGRGDR